MDDGETEYTINLINMKEYPSIDKSDVFNVFSRDKVKDSTFEPQAKWSTMKDSDNLAMVPVNSGSPEYSSAINRFQEQVGKREMVKVRVA